MPLNKCVSILLSSFLAVLSLSGCSGEGAAPDTTLSSEIVAPQQIGTNGQLISIQSDNVRAAGYDEASMVMTVQFNNGYTYEYYGIPFELWESFIKAQPDPWSLVGYPRLVEAGVPYKRII
jgi:hypothetical protein